MVKRIHLGDFTEVDALRARLSQQGARVHAVQRVFDNAVCDVKIPSGHAVNRVPAVTEHRRLTRGTEVTWTPRAGSHAKTKTGLVIEVVPPLQRPVNKVDPSALLRDHVSYVVLVGKKLYWPRVSTLRLSVSRPPGGMT